MSTIISKFFLVSQFVGKIKCLVCRDDNEISVSIELHVNSVLTESLIKVNDITLENTVV